MMHEDDYNDDKEEHTPPLLKINPIIELIKAELRNNSTYPSLDEEDSTHDEEISNKTYYIQHTNIKDLKINHLSAIDKLNALQQAYEYLISLNIQNPEFNLLSSLKSFKLNSLYEIKDKVIDKVSNECYVDCKKIFELPSLELPKYKQALIELFHKTALNIITESIEQPEIRSFAERMDTFLDCEFFYWQTIHWGRTHVRNEICDLISRNINNKVCLPSDIVYEGNQNPLVEFLGDDTNGDTSTKRKNRFNNHLLHYLTINNRNTFSERLGFIKDAYKAIINGTIKYAPNPEVKFIHLKDLKYRHLGNIVEKFVAQFPEGYLNIPHNNPKEINKVKKIIDELIAAWISADNKENFHQSDFEKLMDFVVNYTPKQIEYKRNSEGPFVPFIDMLTTNAQHAEQLAKKFNETYTSYLLHNINSPVDNLKFLANAYDKLNRSVVLADEIKNYIIKQLQIAAVNAVRGCDSSYRSAIENELNATISPSYKGLIDDVRGNSVIGINTVLNKLGKTPKSECRGNLEDALNPPSSYLSNSDGVFLG